LPRAYGVRSYCRRQCSVAICAGGWGHSWVGLPCGGRCLPWPG